MTIYKHALMRFGENILKRYPGHPICLRTDNFSLHGVYIAYLKSSSKQCISVVLISLRLGFRRNFRSVSTSYSQRDYGGVTVCRNLFSQYMMKQRQALIPRALHTYRQVKHKDRLIVKSPVSDVCAILIYYRPNYSVVQKALPIILYLSFTYLTCYVYFYFFMLLFNDRTSLL